MNDFPALLERFARAVVAHDGRGLAGLFTDDGVYDDYFFGPHRGRDAIAAMLDRFHEGGGHYRWDFMDPLSDGSHGYARYRFSYLSKVPESAGKAIVFDGMSHFVFDGDRISHYREVFDRGMALTQLDFAPARVARIVGKYAEALRADAAGDGHLER